MVGLFSLSF